jgi:hypothetical protein
MDTENHDDSVDLAADNAEDYLDTLIDNLRDKIADRTPATVETLTDEIMDHLEAMPIVRQDPQWMPLMASMLAAVAAQRLAYREEGLTPTDDQTRVLAAMAKATDGVWAGSFWIPELARELNLTCHEVNRHTRALARLGMIENL